ncbi:MAG: hypothetical protein KY455_06890 [Euryarchaeota archaeon]|nr:hypothetical protein [Euryarchaeota archaeon]
MHPRLVALVVLALVIAGCTGPEALPRVDLNVEEDPVPEGGTVTVVVSFENDSGLGYPYRTEDCRTYRVWTVVDGDLVEFRPTGQVDCLEPTVERTLKPDARLPPARFVLDLSTYRQADGTPVFVPGTYTVEGAVLGIGDAWDTKGTTTFTVEESLPRIEVEPEMAKAQPGEDQRFRVTFVNTADRPYNYTSSTSCIGFTVIVHDVGGAESDARARLDPPQNCLQAFTEMSIAPGQRIDQEYVWDGTMDGQGGEPAPPGSYLASARFSGRDHAWDATGETLVHVIDPS